MEGVARLCCAQIPGVCMLGIRGHPTTYLAHAHQFVGFLRGNMERTASARAFRTFLKTEAGRKLKDGGSLISAIRKGALKETMYTYHLRQCGAGVPSVFLTMDGVKEIMEWLPDVDRAVKDMLDGLFQEFVGNLSFGEATLDQCAKDDAEEVLDEIFTDGSRGGHIDEQVVHDALVDARIINRALAVELMAQTNIIRSKDAVIEAKSAESATERSAKIVITKTMDDLVKSKDAEIAALKAAAAKDAEIMDLRMRLLRAERSPRSEPEAAPPAKKKSSRPYESDTSMIQKLVFLVAYEAGQGLTPEDFSPFLEIKAIDSVELDGLWVSVFSVVRKRRQHTVEGILCQMCDHGVFVRKTFVERLNGEKTLDLTGLDHVASKIRTRLEQHAVIEAGKLVLHLAELS